MFFVVFFASRHRALSSIYDAVWQGFPSEWRGGKGEKSGFGRRKFLPHAKRSYGTRGSTLAKWVGVRSLKVKFSAGDKSDLLVIPAKGAVTSSQGGHIYSENCDSYNSFDCNGLQHR